MDTLTHSHMPKQLNAKEASQLLQICTATLTTYRKQRLIKSTKKGRKYYYRTNDILKIIKTKPKKSQTKKHIYLHKFHNHKPPPHPNPNTPPHAHPPTLTPEHMNTLTHFPMNYIKHLNNLLAIMTMDQKILPTHISLYMALFQIWNQNRFQNPIQLIRKEVMQAAKIWSLSTYTKCLRQLHEMEYIEYIPSHNPAFGSRVNLYNFCTRECTGTITLTCTELEEPTVQVPVQLPYINIYKHNKEIKQENQPTLDDVLFFFKEKKYPEEEAKKYYNHYQACGWLMGGKAPIKDWKAAAEKWITNSPKFNQQANGTKPKPNNNAGTIKDYSEPL